MKVTNRDSLPPLDPDLASLVAAERSSARGPSRGRRERLRARLAASVALPATGAALSSAIAAAGTTSLGKPVAAVIAIALGTGAAVGVHQLTRSRAVDDAARVETAAGTEPVALLATPAWADERRLVEDARMALGHGRGARALDLLDEHARRFPAGLLVEEREALRVRALVGVGRLDEARAAAARFDASYPASLHREAVRRAAFPSGSSPPRR